MLEFYWNNDKYEVVFHYNHSVDNEGKRIMENIPSDTGCFIFKNDQRISAGIALCNYPAEMPVKKIGRKIALTRALASFDKEFRTLVWKLYFEKTKK